MFVQSEKFVEEHGGRIGDIAVYGQESNSTTRRLNSFPSLAITPTNECFRVGSQKRINDFLRALCN